MSRKLELPNAFLDWWRLLERKLSSVLTSRGISTDVADDIIQEIALVAIKESARLGSYGKFLERFESFGDFFAWARTRAGWMALDKVRAERKNQNVEYAEVTLRPSQYRLALEGEVKKLVEDLPERQREALTGLLHGFSAAEIASRMGVSESTVRSLQRFARSHLAVKLLGDDLREHENLKYSSKQ